nr:PREDICTED: something about silencing protein 10 [Bemisia tabaci]
MKGARRKQPLGSDEEDNLSIDYQLPDSDQELDEDDKAILKKTRQQLHGANDTDSDSEEEVLPLQSSSEDSDDSDDEENSEDEDKDVLGDDEGDLPDPKAWGRKRKNYYDTDYVDQDFGGFQNEKDEEAALMEEEEARAIQRRLAEQLDDLDPVLTFATLGDLTKVVDDADDKKEIIETDFSQMNKRDRITLLQKESPEFLGFIADFKSYLDCVQDNLLSVVTSLKANQLPSTPATQFVLSMTQLIMNYVTNISFYLLLKAQNSTIKNHPVMKHLLQCRELIKEMEPMYKNQIQPELELVMTKISEMSMENISCFSDVSKKKRKLLNLLPLTSSRSKKKKLEEGENSVEAETADDSLNSEESEAESGRDSADEGIRTEETNNIEMNSTDDKRGITYQIAKNKGLTPHRKKENRNPRVKLKNKFRKAKIRRKGQVREVKREIKRYGGEASGIKASVTKSIKIKY